MRTELCLLLALACAAVPLHAQPPQDPETALSPARFSVGLPIEAHVIGAAAGVRPEVSWRPFSADGVFHLRAGAGLLPGSEYLFLPVDLGARWWWRPAWWAQPFVGASIEGQAFVIADGPPTARLAFATELGWGVALDERLTLSVAAAPSLAPFGVPGPGLALRALVSVDVDALAR